MTRWVSMPFLNGVKTYQDVFPYGYNNCYFIDANFSYTGSAQFEKEKDSASSLPLL